MTYIENPKTKGSGIICCIPQKGTCPVKCPHCFFQSGRSYLEPLKDNLPNMPSLEKVGHRIVRVNDGNDSGNNLNSVIDATSIYPLKFYNTSMFSYLNFKKFKDPFVLTLNPREMTDVSWHSLERIPENLMFVRIRVNGWNRRVVDEAIDYYTDFKVPVVLTFMAYNDTDESEIEKLDSFGYIHRKRTLNSYWAVSTYCWRTTMNAYKDNPYVYSCGKIEGEKGTSLCARCGNCLREFFNTMERI